MGLSAFSFRQVFVLHKKGIHLYCIMENQKNKDVLKKLYLLSSKSDRHAKRKQKTDQKPNERKLQADLPK